MSNTTTAEELTGKRDPKRAAMSGWIGSALEYYDYSLYTQAAALVFPTIFFPSGNATIAIMLSLATYAIGYVLRPVGAVVLGAWGDRKGRKNVLVFAMVLMGFSTFAIGLLPTYAQLGIWSPLMLVLLRVVQGFAVAGELGGASAMIVEHSPDERRGFFASFSLQGTQVGSIMAIGVMLPLSIFLDKDAFHSWGWRIPFLLSAIVIVAGYIIRRKVEEPPAFTAQAAETAKQRFPFVELITRYPWITVRCILMTLTNVIGTATLVFGASFATQDAYGNGFSTDEFLWVTLTANLVAIGTIPIFGALSDRIGRRTFMIVGGLGGGALAGVYLWTIEQHHMVLVFVSVIIVQSVFFQMWNATFATFFQEQFPMRIRVTGFAVAQNIGLALASFFPMIITAVVGEGSDNVPLVVGGITFAVCAIAAGAAALTRETKGTSLAELDGAGSVAPVEQRDITTV